MMDRRRGEPAKFARRFDLMVHAWSVTNGQQQASARINRQQMRKSDLCGMTRNLEVLRYRCDGRIASHAGNSAC